MSQGGARLVDVCEAALGALVRYPRLVKGSGLEAKDFVAGEQRRVFEALPRANAGEGKMAHRPALALEAGVGIERIHALPLPANEEMARDRLARARQHILAVRLGGALKKVLSNAPAGDTPGTDRLQEIREVLREFGGQGDDGEELPTLVEATQRYIQDALSHLEYGATPGYSTGIPTLDRCIRGLRPAEITVLAARPGHGKSTFALDLALKLAGEGVPGIYFSAEMSAQAFGERSAYLLAGSPLHGGALGQGALARARHEADKRGSALSLVRFAFDGRLSLELLERRLRGAVEQGAGYFVVDNLKHVNHGNGLSDFERISDGIRRLRHLALELHVPGLVLHHLNRQAEMKDAKPSLAWLRASGEIEEEADVVIFLERQMRDPFEGTGAHGRAFLSVLKSRQGAAGVKIELEFDKGGQTYREAGCA